MKPFPTLLESLALMSSSIQAKEANVMATQTISRADIQAVAPALDKYAQERSLGCGNVPVSMRRIVASSRSPR
jgi:hypothetical protein